METSEDKPELKVSDKQDEPTDSEAISIDDKGEVSDDVQEPEVKDQSKLHRFKVWYLERKKWTIPLSIMALLLVLFLIPWTRYQIAGLFVKNDFSVKLTDSTAHTPVSGAQVSIGSISATTDGNGQATLHSVKVGDHTLLVSKKYYKDLTESVLVPILDQKTIPNYQVIATGRQVKIVTTNLINGQKIEGATIKVADTQAKTDKNGEALVVLSANSTSEKATISAAGFNDSSVTVLVSNTEVKENDFKLTPAGKVYFLSKLSGTIDVVKTNLDGTDRQTVLAGTGKEDDTGTVLLASRDWKYLALLSKRDGPQKLFVINTDDDKLLTMDEGDATFSAVGWYNHYFVYKVARTGYNAWQANATSIKSYNAESGQNIPLVNSNASGSSNSDAQYENIFDTIIMGNDVVYTRTWYAYPGYLKVDGKQNVLAAIHPDGTSSRQIKSVDSGSLYISNLKLNKPRELYFGVYSSDGSASTTYFVLDKNGNVTQSSTLTDQDLTGEAVSYLASPSGSQTFWSDERDGKNTLFIGDQDAGGAKQIASLSSYDTYGWYTDNYLLVSKDSSELYIMPVSGIKADSAAIKVTDYHKPDYTFYGYGGGYGGL